MFDVACIGILVCDVIAGPVDKIPDQGKLGLIERIGLHTGGCAANTAVDLARIGLNAAVIGKIGNDGFGEYISRTMLNEKVDTRGLVIEKEISTSASVVLSDTSGERTFLHSLGANAVFTDRDVDFQIIKDSRIIHVAGSMLLPSFDGEPCAGVLKKAKDMGKFTAMDTAWDSKGRWMKILEPCMRYIDLFVPSYEEAVALCGKNEPEEICDVFLSMGVKISVVKLGKEGCFIKAENGEKYLIPACSNIHPVDTTGAGDAFVAGFLTGCIKGWNLYECGKFANAVGAHCVMEVGATAGIKSLEEVQEFIRKKAFQIPCFEPDSNKYALNWNGGLKDDEQESV